MAKPLGYIAFEAKFGLPVVDSAGDIIVYPTFEDASRSPEVDRPTLKVEKVYRLVKVAPKRKSVG